MRLLLDTHALIWLDSASARLSTAVRQAIGNPTNETWFSSASIWEIQIKVSLGKLQLLPAIHKDPFDRILASQSIVEGMMLVTNDNIFARYPVATFW